jgi:hypothetical protein
VDQNQITAAPVTPEAPKKQYWQDILSDWKASGEKQQALFCRPRDSAAMLSSTGNGN